MVGVGVEAPICLKEVLPMHKLRRLAAVGAALALLIPLAPGTAQAVTPTTSAVERGRVDRVPTPKLNWRDCEFVQCATVRLPLDYDQPDGETVDIAVTRIPARDPARRIGSLFLNPGGPGGSGAQFPIRAREWMGSEVLDRFDLIGMDPRGTNGSTTTRCFPTVRRLDRVAGTLIGMSFPVTGREESRFVSAARELARGCSGFGRRLASSISTAEVARDMDVLRRAVGDRQLTFLGFSYGTYLGQVYANMFPDRVRAIAIDGVIDPTEWVGTARTAGTPMSVRMDSTAATSAALQEVLRRCERAAEVCGVPDPRGTFARVAAALKSKPLVIEDPEGDVTLTYQQFIATAVFSLYTEEGAATIPLLAATVDQLRSPTLADARRASLSERYRRISSSVLESAAGYSNAVELVPAVMCSDSRNPHSPRTWSAMAAAEDARAPYVGRFWLWNSVYCAGQLWGAYDEDAYRGRFDTATANPVLVVGNLHDPATSYRAARSVARLLPRSRLLTSTNWGHTAYGVSACATRHVDRYLLRGSLPAQGTVCDDRPGPFEG